MADIYKARMANRYTAGMANTSDGAGMTDTYETGNARGNRDG